MECFFGGMLCLLLHPFLAEVSRRRPQHEIPVSLKGNEFVKVRFLNESGKHLSLHLKSLNLLIQKKLSSVEQKRDNYSPSGKILGRFCPVPYICADLVEKGKMFLSGSQ